MSCDAYVTPPKRYSIPGALKCLACHQLTPSLPQTFTSNLGYCEAVFHEHISVIIKGANKKIKFTLACCSVVSALGTH